VPNVDQRTSGYDGEVNSPTLHRKITTKIKKMLVVEIV
jgi:hypothetical protein